MILSKKTMVEGLEMSSQVKEESPKHFIFQLLLTTKEEKED